MTDPSAQALLLMLDQGFVPKPAGDARILYAGALNAPGLAQKAANWRLWQSFRPWALDLQQTGLNVSSDWPEEDPYDIALVMGAKQKEESRHRLARAALMLREGGWLLCAAAKDAGGNRLADDLAALGLQPETTSKFHARIAHAQKTSSFNSALAEVWRTDGELTRHPATGFITRPGLFSWNRVDEGSALLAQHLPQNLTGTGADFGCGYGYLSREMLRLNPNIETLHAIDADFSALEACRLNLNSDKAVFHWLDLTREKAPGNLDWIVMNPPFHEGKMTDAAIGIAFIGRAANALKKGGRLFMVANQQLPYEDALAPRFRTIDKLFEGQGYKILAAAK